MERGFSLEADTIRGIITLAEKGNTTPSMKEIAQLINNGRDLGDEVTSRKIGQIVTHGLRLEKQDRRHVMHLVWDDTKIKKLCEKYGITQNGEAVRVGRKRIIPWDLIPDL